MEGEQIADPVRVVEDAFNIMPLALLVADGYSYTKGDMALIAVDALRQAGWAVVPAKQEHKGPRAQVITPSDGVVTREGQILAVALHAAEERELDLLAKIGRLERQLAHNDGVERG